MKLLPPSECTIPQELEETAAALFQPDIHGFKRGDIVWVDTSNEMGMSHFKSNCYAVIKDSYYSKYGSSTGTDKVEYTLIYLNSDGSLGGSSWYPASSLTIVKR